jgi:DNA-binding transcriptional LysR family regulator
MASDRLGDMRLFVAAAEFGGLSAAGRKLALSPAAASARLLKLEKDLRTRLFERTTRQLRLTDEGQLYLEHCRVALQAVDDGEAALLERQSVVRGRVRIAATSDFGRNLLCGWLNEFSAQYPDITFALTLGDAMSHLLQDEIDLAIRFAVPLDSTLVARSLAPNWRVLCASPAYLARHGEPTHPSQLDGHRFMLWLASGGVVDEFHFSRNGERHSYRVPPAHAWETSDGAVSRAWTLDGHGLSHKSIWDVAADVHAGRLKIVLPDWRTEETAVHALFHRNRYMAPRVRLLLDFLVGRFERAGAELLAGLARPA